MAAKTNTIIPLSRLTSNPVLRDFFERGEKDTGMQFAVPAPVSPVLTGGAEADLEDTRELEFA